MTQKGLGVCVAWQGMMALLLTLSAATALAQTVAFSVPFMPTGIAFETGMNLVVVSEEWAAHVYDTNGVPNGGFGTTWPFWDLGARTAGTAYWTADGIWGFSAYYGGDPLAMDYGGGYAIGRQLTVGGTNYVMHVHPGFGVAAYNATNTFDPTLLPTLLMPEPPYDVTGADWIMRPGGSRMGDVYIALSSWDRVLLYLGDGTLHSTINFSPGLYGSGDVAFGPGGLWVAHRSGLSGQIAIYPCDVPAVGTTAGSPRLVWESVGKDGLGGTVSRLAWTNDGSGLVLQGAGSVTGGWIPAGAALSTNGNWIHAVVTNSASVWFFRLAK